MVIRFLEGCGICTSTYKHTYMDNHTYTYTYTHIYIQTPLCVHNFTPIPNATTLSFSLPLLTSHPHSHTQPGCCNGVFSTHHFRLAHPKHLRKPPLQRYRQLCLLLCRCVLLSCVCVYKESSRSIVSPLFTIPTPILVPYHRYKDIYHPLFHLTLLFPHLSSPLSLLQRVISHFLSPHSAFRTPLSQATVWPRSCWA